MRDQDVKEGGEYKKDSVFREKERQTQVSRKEKETRRILREESEQCHSLIILASLGSFVGRHLLIYSITSTFSSLFSSSSRALTYKFY